jgi:PEP-CTERM motif
MAMADVTYDVSVSSPSLTTTSGFIDFQFNPADSSSLFATADLNNFATDGSVGAQAYQSGDATGPAGGPLTTLSFDNGTALNELTYNSVYGTTMSFDLTLSGPALSGGAPSGASTTFSFTLYDPSGDPYSTGPGGSIVTIVINPDGSTTGTAYSPSSAGGPTATVTQQGVVPEPSTLLLSIIGFGTLFGWHQVRRRAAA